MATIAEKLRVVAEQKAEIKAALEAQGKEPTDALGTYAGMINDLENPALVHYTVTVDGVNKAYAQLYGEQKVTLTATENDIRVNKSAITEKGYTDGKKNIPSYQTEIGVKIIQPNVAVVLQNDNKYDYTKILTTLSVYGTKISDSVQVDKVTVDNVLYVANSTMKLSDLSKDHANRQVNFGIINGEKKAVMRYSIIKEEN